MSIITTIASFVGGLFKPASELIDDLHTSEEERLKLKNKLAEIQASVQTKLIELETKQLEVAQKVIIAESKSDSTFTKNWRPVTIVLLITLVILGAFKVIETPSEIWKLLEGFLYVYGGSRGLEKISSTLKLGK
jgi:hypothetical protein